MKFSIWHELKLPQPTARQVRGYLLRHDWTIQPWPGPETIVFEGGLDDNDKPILQVLPSSESMPSYAIRLQELLGSLSVLENRPMSEILADIFTPSTNGPTSPGRAASRREESDAPAKS